MNILVLNYEFPPIGGGGGPVSRDLAQQLVKRGHNVSVVTMGFHNLPMAEIMDGVHIFRVKCWRKESSVCHPWEQMTYIISAMFFLKKHFQNNKYDICHAHFIIPTGVLAYLIKKIYNIPYIITAHGSDVEGYNAQRFKTMHMILRKPWTIIVNQAQAVVSPSEYLLKLLKKQKSNGIFKLIPNGFDVDFYQNLVKDKQNKKKSILVMGRMQKTKNMQTIIRAFSRIETDDYVLDILGDGPYKAKLEELIKELHIENRVILHGWVDNKSKEQLAYLSSASIYVSASYFENCPMAVLESIAAKCYPLLSDIPAHRQIIDKDEYFFEADDIESLAEKLQHLVNMGCISFPNINLLKYQWNKVVDEYEYLLHENNQENVLRSR